MIAPPGQTGLSVVREATQAGEVRRAALALAEDCRFPETAASNLAIVVTELATNLVRHARGGEILLTACDEVAEAAIDVLSVDAGPGMSDVSRCLQDGFSTAGTPGGGLGAVRRLAQEFDLHSERGKGTVVFARLYAGERATGAKLQYAGIRLPLASETECGDAWSVMAGNGHASFLVADGLGHGPLAATASRTAVRTFRAGADRQPADVMQTLHLALRSTRGAAAGLARVDFASGEIRFCGVGNTSFVLAGSGRQQQMVSHNGTLGHQATRFHEFSYPWNNGNVLVMHSDGLSARWDASRYPGLLARHPGVIAGVLYRDFRRTRDDVSVLVARTSHA